MSDKAQAVVTLAGSKLGDPYVFGARGEQCTTGVRRQYAAYHPEYRDKIFGACPVLSGKQGSCDGCKWHGHRCYDCRGFTYYVLREAAQITINGGGATTQYDTASNWAIKGKTDQMPDLVCCVFKRKQGKMSHTGLHVGGGRIIHCSTIVKEGSTTDKTWTHYAIPLGLYTTQEILDAGVVTLRATIRRGSRGDDVRQLQQSLYSLGQETLMIDGAFGPKTEEAVRVFQAKCGLAVDGIVGPKTWAAINDLLTQQGRLDLLDDEDIPPATKTEPEPAPAREELTLENNPLTVYYPAGQALKFDNAAAAALVEALSMAMSASADGSAEIVLPTPLEVSLTAVGAMNLWQQIRDSGVTTVG